MIDIINLSKSYSSAHVLANVNLTIAKGDIYGLVGRSGAGKSTLLRCINGLETFQTGKVIVNNTDIRSLSNSKLRGIRKDIGMIFQDFSLIERKTVYDNVSIPMQCWNIPKSIQKSKIEALLEIVGLSDKIWTKARDISGGQKQRVAIARAMVMNPSILLSDEATSALDPRTTDEILELLTEINKKYGLTIVIVTHEMSVVQKICNKMAILENGVCEIAGDVMQIFATQPPALLNFLGEKEIAVPDHGCTVQLVALNKKTQQEFLYKMSREVEQEYRLVSSNVSRYRDGTIGFFVLNFEESSWDKYSSFFDREKISYQVFSKHGKCHG